MSRHIRSCWGAVVVLVTAGAVQLGAQRSSIDALPLPRGTLPLNDALSTYRPVGKRVSPQDGFAIQHSESTVPTPRDANGHPDMTAMWGAAFPSPLGSTERRKLGSFEPDQAVMQRAAQWNKPLYKPEYWAKVRSLDFGRADVDPNYACHTPTGVPRQNVPARIIQKADQIVLFNGNENMIRILPLTGEERDPNDYEYSTVNGMGLAHWDGDTLIIESVGFSDVTWLGWEGYFHSDQMTVTERFRRDGDLLFYNFTVDDPEVLMEPWTSITYVRRAARNVTRLDEALPCDERDLELMADPYNRG